MDHAERVRWFAREVLPCEPDVRGWLIQRIRGVGMCDTDEVIQETYARLWAADVSSILNVRAYMFVTARRVLGDVIRRSRIVPIQTMADIDTLNIADGGATPDRRLSGMEEVERLRQAMASLPLKCREAFELKKIEELSQREIAQRMGIAESTVEKHLAKALRLVMLHMQTQPSRASWNMERDESRRGHR